MNRFYMFLSVSYQLIFSQLQFSLHYLLCENGLDTRHFLHSEPDAMLCPVEDAEGTLQVKASLVSIPVLVFLGPAAQSINRTSVGHPVVVCVLALGDSDITTLPSCNDHLSNYTASYNYLSITTTTSNTDALHSRLLTVVL